MFVVEFAQNLRNEEHRYILADLEIASIAIANDLTLITNNVRHFKCIPLLQFENWL